MQTALLTDGYVSVEDYLASEELSPVKREYLGGVIYAMAGASDAHNRITQTLYGMLYARLRGRRCESFGSDMRLQLRPQPSGRIYYYYPDAMIVCDPTDNTSGRRERPSAIFEITSESTRDIDEREKSAAYLQIQSLEAYIRIEQERMEATVEHRTVEGWRLERITGPEGVIRLPTLGVELPLAELYERVTFAPVEAEEPPDPLAEPTS